jgi:ribosome-associated protein
MPRPDEKRPPAPRPDALPADEAPRAPSKTQQKREMHALQDLGEALVALDAKRFDALAEEARLPERLVDAIRAARAMTAWGARKRQLQYVGKLMRDQDPAPIRRRLDLWAQGHGASAARDHALERWRERLLAEPDALTALAAAYPRLDRTRVRALVAKATEERTRGAPPRAYRELFRELRALDAHPEASTIEVPAAAPPASHE